MSRHIEAAVRLMRCCTFHDVATWKQHSQPNLPGMASHACHQGQLSSSADSEQELHWSAALCMYPQQLELLQGASLFYF